MSGKFVTSIVLLAYAACFASFGDAQAATHHKKPSRVHAKVRAKLQARPRASLQAVKQSTTPPPLVPASQPVLQTVSQPVGQSNGPTLAETTEWIESHVASLTHGSSRTIVTYKVKNGKPLKEESRDNLSSHESVSVAKFDGCTLTLGQLTRGDDFTVVTVSTIPFDRLGSASWKVEKLDSSRTEAKDEVTETTIVPGSVAVLTLDASTNVIGFRRRSTGSIPLEWIKTPFEGSRSSLVIRSDDQEMPPRMVNAFNHAILLCHKDLKPEPF